MIDVVQQTCLTPEQYAAILDLCSRAYEEDFSTYLAALADATHVLLQIDNEIVSHAAWITRWLGHGDLPLLRTGYIEAVATDPAYERRGYATHVLVALKEQITGFDCSALSPATYHLYERLGWKLWRGKLFARKHNEVLEMPDEEAMILCFPHTPNLDFAGDLSIEWREGEVW